MQTALSKGTVIDSTYRVEKVLGMGGFGVVYLCEDFRLGQRVVLKECYPDDPDLNLVRDGDEICAADEKSRDMFIAEYKLKAEAEAVVLGKVNHDNIVKVHNIVKANGTVYIVMPYVEGESFASIIRRYKSNNKNLSEEFLLYVLKKILLAVDYVHSLDIVHKDIKSENIIITPDNKPVLIDFGAARSRSKMISQGRHTMICSGGYSPPESKDPNIIPDARYDIYSIGAVFYEAVAGFAPTNSDIRIYRDDILNLCESFAGRYGYAFLSGIDKALSLSRKGRFASAGEWLDYLNSPAGSPRKNLRAAARKERAPAEPLNIPLSLAEPEGAPSANRPEPAGGEFAENAGREPRAAYYLLGLAWLISSIIVFVCLDDLKCAAGLILAAVAAAVIFIFLKSGSAKSRICAGGGYLLLCGGDSFEFFASGGETVLVGRSLDCDIRIPNFTEKYKSVSRKHFTLTLSGNGFLIENMRADRNPIYVDGQELASAKEIGLGKVFVAGGLKFKIVGK